MLKSLFVLMGLLFMAAPAEAHRRYHQGSFIVWQTGHQHHPRQPKVRLDEHCVWKPWKQKVVCKY